VEATLDAIRDNMSPRAPFRAFTQCDEEDARSQAAASTRRWASGKPLGPLDGVPVAVKETVDVKGYFNNQVCSLLFLSCQKSGRGGVSSALAVVYPRPCFCPSYDYNPLLCVEQGTRFLGAQLGRSQRDCISVARLKEAGAVIVGMTCMHEIGMGVSGCNIQDGGPHRNPHNLMPYSGGSSSGRCLFHR